MSVLRRHQQREATDVDITPLLDVMFLLVIFFMVATSFHEETRTLDIELPRANAPNILTLDDAIRTIAVTAEGRLFLDDEELDPAALEHALRTAAADAPSLRVLVRADAEAAYRHVAEVLDTLHATEIDGVSFAVTYAGW